MLPTNPGGHAAYQDTFVSEFLKFYPDPFVLPKSTWDYIVQFWYLDLSQTDSIAMNETTVLELIKRYRGEAKFDVKLLENGDKKNLVSFASGEYEAIKDEILNAEVLHFTSINKNSSIPTIEILIEKLAIKETGPEMKPEQGDGSDSISEPSTSEQNASSNE